jgi:tetratricopeptide (TPR) repeat protein
MVSRVYTPPLPYTRSQGSALQRGVPSATDEKRTSSSEGERIGSREQSGSDEMAAIRENARSAGLQSVQYDSAQKIPLNAVLGDFHKTMTALGADAPTRSEMDAYIQVISAQGAKSQPDVPYIKHTLRTAAHSLDQYIGKALGQPSNVVKEWVDALLLQNIDFHSDAPFEKPAETAKKSSESDADTKNSSQNTEQEANTLLVEVDANPQAILQTTSATSIASNKTGLNLTEKKQLKTLIETAKTAHQAGDASMAEASLQQALGQLNGKAMPEWEGKINRLRGRFAEQGGQWENAITAYEQAEQGFAQASRLDRQADSRHAIASLLEDHNRLPEAKASYQQVLALDESRGDTAAQVRSLQDLGRIDLRLGQSDSAIATLKSAVQRSETISLSPIEQNELLSTLALTYRRAGQLEPAVTTYREASRLASRSGNLTLYTDTLRHYASTLIEAGHNTQAAKVLEVLKRK